MSSEQTNGMFANAGELRRQAEIVAGLEAAACRNVRIAPERTTERYGYVVRLAPATPEGEGWYGTMEIHGDERELRRLIALLSAARP